MNSLQAEITKRRQKISTDAYSMSIGELTNLYRDNEIDIHPEFQRVYRWGEDQKSKLIESVLLGIPLPSIFVAQTEDGTWDVVDGVQRISTLLELQGLLNYENGTQSPMLRLKGTQYLPQLEGRAWEDSDPEKSLTQAQRLDIRRAKIDLKIIKRESTPEAKYDLFQRLNSYGTLLTRQEVRSCMIISADRTFYEWLVHLRLHPAFVETIALNDRLADEQYDLELVLRFITIRTLDQSAISKIGYIGDFLDREAVRISTDTDFDRENEARRFNSTFDLLADSAGDEIFRKYDQGKRGFKGAFQNTAFEVFALGLGYHIDYYADHPEEANIRDRAQNFWTDEGFPTGFATGKSADERMAQTVDRGRKLFKP